jgi:hypothetical protein
MPCWLLGRVQLLQGELDSLKAERGKAQRKNLEVCVDTGCKPCLAALPTGACRRSSDNSF